MNGAEARFGDCLHDPGPLEHAAAVHTINIHCHCPPACLVKNQAIDALTRECSSVPLTIKPSSDATSGWRPTAGVADILYEV